MTSQSGVQGRVGGRPHPQFTASAEAYDRFMGRWADSLAPALVDAAGVASRSDGAQRVVDVGCGPGALAGALAARVGAERVAAVDPAPRFVEACRARLPGADVRQGVAEELPWADGAFDAALSCLVIGFMTDPDRGVAEMRRVTRTGGAVALCMWDLAGDGMAMLAAYWAAAKAVDPAAPGERQLPGAAEGDIAERLRRAGLRDVVGGALPARVDYAGFDDFWEPFTAGIGPAAHHLASLPPEQRAAVRSACREALGDEPFTLEARAWWARGTVP